MSVTAGTEAASTATATKMSEGDQPVTVDPRRHATTWLWSEEPDGGVEIVRTWDGSAWRGWTRTQLAAHVLRVAGALVAAGVEPGDRVVVMGRTRLEWTVADLAILSAAAVTVPVYETSTAEQCGHVLASCGARLAFADSASCRARLEEGWAGGGVVVAMEDGGLEAFGAGAGDDDMAVVEERLDDLDGTALATIIYTSGTTGVPRGCRLTHANLVWTSAQCRARLAGALDGEASTLLFLPLAHVFARVVQLVCLEAGVPVGYARSLPQLRDDLASFRPTLVLAVPAVLQRVFDRARISAAGRLKAGIFDFAVKTAEACSRPAPAGSRHRSLDARRAVADRLVYARVRHGLGGRLRYCVSGGAPLPLALARFFSAAGITVLEGYGLTETSAPLSVNVPGELRLGTVGRPLPGVTVRLADDGEILVRGGNVFAGYHDDRAATTAALADGWLRTGDLGRIDDGYITVTGRKKDLIVLSTGKKVAPGPLEERLRAAPVVADAMVVGDDRPYVVALISLDPEAVEAANLRDATRVEAEVRRAVEAANQGLSRVEAIRSFAVLDRGLTLEAGELTPTLKLRRGVVAEHFADVIASLYAPGPGTTRVQVT
jgi:long-chain acyl-CoA synthetase